MDPRGQGTEDRKRTKKKKQKRREEDSTRKKRPKNGMVELSVMAVSTSTHVCIFIIKVRRHEKETGGPHKGVIQRDKRMPKTGEKTRKWNGSNID